MVRDDKKIQSVLAGLGLTPVEARTYLALLGSEPTSIRKIAASTGINRGTTYEALKRLTSAGLTSVRKEGSREHYMAESPERLLELIREQRRDLVAVAEATRRIMPDLLARKSATKGEPLVRYYQDDEGIVTILKDILQTCQQLEKREYCAYSSSTVRQYLYRKFPHFTSQRIAYQIHVRVIAIGEGGDPAAQSERKWIKADDVSNSSSSYTIIYGNKIATIAITENDTPYGVVIEDAGAASMQRLLFNQLWSYL